jgi:hypothetical protein
MLGKRKPEPEPLNNAPSLRRNKLTAFSILCYNQHGHVFSGDVLDIRIIGVAEKVSIQVAVDEKELVFEFKEGMKNAWVQGWRLPCSAEENTSLGMYVHKLLDTFCDRDCLYWLDREKNAIVLA